MTTFAPGIHTPEALGDEITRIHDSCAAARLGGSLGRAVVYGLVRGNPNYEYEIRGQDPLRTGSTARDIDLIGSGEVHTSTYEPFEVDTTGFASPFLNLEEQDGDWHLTASHHRFAEPLHQDVMRPIRGETVYGIPSVTLPPQTLLALYGIKGRPRAKDILNRGLLQEVCNTLPGHDQLSDDLFKPFKALTLLNQASWYIRAQDRYRRTVPEPIRTKFVPIMSFTKKLIH